MPDINDLRRQRAEVSEKTQALAKLEDNGTELSAEQLDEFVALQSKFEALSAKIDRAEAAEKMAAATAKPVDAIGANSLPAEPKQPAIKGGKVARMVKAIGAVGHGGREAAHYAEQVLGDADVAAALNTQDAAAGGVLIPQAFVSDIIELLQPKTVVRGMGAQVLPMPHGNLTIPKMSGGATSAYLGESADIEISEQSFGDLQLSAKNLATLVPVSNQLLNYSGITPSIERVITNDMIASMGLREDLAFIRGDGAGDTPKGFRHAAHAANIVVASDGSTVAKVKNDLGKLQLALQNANVGMVSPGWVMNPTKAMFLMDLVDGNGNAVFPEMANGTLRGYPYRTTTQVPNNLGAGDESEIYFVDFNDAIIGDAESTTLAISTEASYIDPATGKLVSAFSKNQTLIRVVSAHDFGMRYDQSVAVLTGVKWQP